MPADRSADALLSVLRGFRLSPHERDDFARADPQATLRNVRLLTAAAVYFNTLAVGDFGGRLGPTRGLHLVEQVIGAAFQTYGGVDPHAGPFQRAAMLLRGITQGHPFNDGNKRTGLLLAAYYLDVIGHPYPPQLPIEATVHLCFRVSAGAVRDIDLIAAELEQLWTGRTTEPEGP